MDTSVPHKEISVRSWRSTRPIARPASAAGKRMGRCRALHSPCRDLRYGTFSTTFPLTRLPGISSIVTPLGHLLQSLPNLTHLALVLATSEDCLDSRTPDLLGAFVGGKEEDEVGEMCPMLKELTVGYGSVTPSPDEIVDRWVWALRESQEATAFVCGGLATLS